MNRTYINLVNNEGVQFTANFLGFSRMRHNFSEASIFSENGVFPESVVLRRDSPCRFIETWLWVDKNPEQAYITISTGSTDYYTFSAGINEAYARIIAFSDNAGSIRQVKYGSYLFVVEIPTYYKQVTISYESRVQNVTFSPSLYYYQLNQN